MGGLLAFAVAAPIMVLCCGGGGIFLTALLAGIGGWLSGLGGIAILTAALSVFLVWRHIRRNRACHTVSRDGQARLSDQIAPHVKSRDVASDMQTPSMKSLI